MKKQISMCQTVPSAEVLFCSFHSNIAAMKRILRLSILGCIVPLYIVHFSSCSADSSEEPPPIIRHLGIEYGRYDSLSGMAGAFNFHSTERVTPVLDKVFIEFGGDMIWGACPPDCGISRHFIYRLPPQTQVYAPIDGYVLDIGFDSNWQDFEIILGSSRRSGYWYVVIDHVLDLQVQKGDRIEAGQCVANVGNGALEIDLSSNSGTHCMLSYFDPETVTEWRQKVSDLMHDWETFIGDQTLYDQESMLEPGCVVQMVPR